MPRLIRSQPLIPTQESASGVWSLDDAFNAVKTKTWPIAGRIVRSLRFNDDESSYLSRTPASASDRQKMTWSFWVKPSSADIEHYMFTSGTGNSGWTDVIRFYQNKLTFGLSDSNTSEMNLTPTQVFRDFSAWYHIVCALDTTQATASNRAKIYVNGEQVTSFDTNTYPAQNFSTRFFNTATAQQIGRSSYSSNQHFDGYLAEINFIDGQALTADSFGELRDGVWSPIDTAGLTFGTNGFYLKFNDSTDPGKDVSGNGNDFTANNLFANDVIPDSVKDNFCTWNPLSNTGTTLANGNLDFSGGSSTVCGGTLAVISGKWYWECSIQSTINPSNPFILAFASASTIAHANAHLQSAYLYSDNGTNNKVVRVQNSSQAESINMPSSWLNFAIGDVLQFAYDGDTGKIWLGVNNEWCDNSGGITGNPSAGTNPTFTLSDTDIPMTPLKDHAGPAWSGHADFGQLGFTYTPPEGYLPLSTDALPATVTPSDYFNTVLYTGTGATQSITGVGFQPDFTWIKNRSSAQSHSLSDAVRGFSNILQSNETSAEASGGGVSVISDGFTLENGNALRNASGDTYVAWCWKAGGAPVSNTDGSIASQVSANTDAGFSIVSYTGTGSDGSVGHGLSQTPEFFILKNRDDTSDWYTYTTIVDGSMDYFFLNTTAAKGDSGLTAPTSSLIYVGGSQAGNSTSGEDQIIYAFHSVEGFSKFGLYTGNGSADGPFVYTGFKPAFVLMKDINNTNSWIIMDNMRTAEYNPQDGWLVAHSSVAEYNVSSSDSRIDLLSNGFKLRNSNAGNNGSDRDYIYMAFAETPLKTTRAR